LGSSLHFFYSVSSLLFTLSSTYTNSCAIKSASFSLIDFLNVSKHNFGASKLTVILAPRLK